MCVWNLSDQSDVAKLQRLYSANVVKGEKRFEEYHEDLQLVLTCSLSHFIRTGEYVMEHDGDPVVWSADIGHMFKVHRDGGIRQFGFGFAKLTPPRERYSGYGSGPNSLYAQANAPPGGVVLPFGTKMLSPEASDCAFPLLLNGDEEYGIKPASSLHGDVELDKFNFPTLSLQCLGRLVYSRWENDWAKQATNYSKLCKALSDGVVEVVDYTPDRSQELTEAEKKLRTKDKLVPPSGFTLILQSGRYVFHQSATVVVRDNDYETPVYFLLGQDEETYFGCELTGKPQTVQEAFDDLVPDEAKVPGTLRQGEWFAVPVKTKDVPKEEDCFAFFDDSSGSWNRDGDFNLFLPRQDPLSNKHYVGASGEGRISPEGVFAKGATLRHDEHEDLGGDINTWYTFYRNTAVRSVSVGGVD